MAEETTPTGAAKPGYLTTEFWVTVLIALGAVVGELASVLPPKWGSLLATLSAAAYAISRGLAKSGTTTGP